MKTFSKSDFKLARDCPAKLTWKERGYPSRDDGNPYLALLAEGGYMVEQLARLGFADGVELEYDPQQPREAWAHTEAALAAGDGTWFEATLLAGHQLVRVDILRRRGDHFDLFEVKSKSFDGEDIDRADGPFRAKRSPFGILAPWRPYLEDVTYQVHVLQQCFPDATITPHLIVVDKSRTTDIDGLPRMFEIKRGGAGEKDLEIRFTGDPTAINPMELLQVIDVSSEVDELLPDVAAFAASQLVRYGDSEVAHVEAPIGMHCGKCEYRVPADTTPSGFRECWGTLADVSPSVLELYKFGSTKHDGEKLGDVMIRNGRIGLDEVDPAHLIKKDGSPTAASTRQLLQIHHTAAGTPWYGEGLAPKLEAVRYPLHFIDFETSALALPYHADMRPYQSIGFQWSCHTIAAPGAEPVHREWLNTVDLWPSLEFVETLRATIGDTGSVLMWSPHERTIMRAIRTQLEAYGRGNSALLAWLEPFADKDHPETRLIDQHKICETEFFHPRMANRTSIKNVLDAVWQEDRQVRERFVHWMGDDSYEVSAGVGPYECLPPVQVGGTLLEVAEGTGAMRAYQAMLYGAEREDEATKAAWVELLRRYCKLDTLAMVLIWDHWRRVVGR
jgi:hypothetical protein